MDHVGELAADLWLSKFRINVRPSVQQKCHPFGLRWYQMKPLLMRSGARRVGGLSETPDRTSVPKP